MMKRLLQFSLAEFEHFTELVKSCMDGYLYILDIEQDRYYISANATERFNLPSNSFTDTAQVFRSFIHPDDYDWLMEDIRKLTSGESDSHNLDYRWLSRDGSPIWIHCRGRSVRDENGIPRYMLGCVDEIGRKQRADNVSGLKGSAFIEQQADALFSNPTEGYCLHIGIDDFRAINESFGMDYGNLILRAVADSITQALSPEQEVYRAMADEYFILSHHGSVFKDGQALYEQIRRNVEHFVAQNHYESVFTISCGAADAQSLDGLKYTQAIQLTQFAMSQAKKLGKNQIHFYTEENYKRFVREQGILRAIKESVASNFEGFSLHFQPIMERGNDTAPYSAEALLRFRTRSGENISPAELIPIMEESGMILPVGKWILNEAMVFCAQRRKLYPEFKVNVNISYVQVMKGSFLNDFFQMLDQHHLPSSSVTVELTESGKIEGSPQVSRLWGILKLANVNIALDDFGTGFSNLLYISEMTPNIIKLDRSFTVKSMNHSFERMLMANTIQMVHSLGLKVCVEGVETEAELAQVCELGADYIQGYYYGKPCPGSEFMERFP